jgi:hypothetical protein
MRLLHVTCYTGREAAARGWLDRGAAAHGEGAARSPTLHPPHHQGDNSHLHQSRHGTGFRRRGTVVTTKLGTYLLLLSVWRGFAEIFFS